jgi:hypothetical protein
MGNLQSRGAILVKGWLFLLIGLARGWNLGLAAPRFKHAFTYGDCYLVFLPFLLLRILCYRTLC